MLNINIICSLVGKITPKIAFCIFFKLLKYFSLNFQSFQKSYINHFQFQIQRAIGGPYNPFQNSYSESNWGSFQSIQNFRFGPWELGQNRRNTDIWKRGMWNQPPPPPTLRLGFLMRRFMEIQGYTTKQCIIESKHKYKNVNVY